MELDVLCRVEAEVGESPLWDDARQCLWWVDLLKGELHRFDPAAGVDHCHATIGQSLGFVAPLGSDELVAGTRDSVGTLSLATGEYSPKAAVERDRAGYRANDGKCDPQGRLWFGTMSDEQRRDGRWYRVDADWDVIEWRGDGELPNGLCWSPDRSRLYLADSGRSVVEVWSCDPDDGLPTALVNTLEFPPEQGCPDGMTIDADGCIWVALWGGGAVRRYRPDGTLDRQLDLPLTLAASCEFGGKQRDLLFITSARYQLTAEQLAAEPLAGAIFVCRPGPVGLPANAFDPRSR